MDNFCTNCGNRLEKDDNFCTNCGTKIDKSDMKPKMSEDEIKSIIINRLERTRIAKEKEMGSNNADVNEANGGYCNYGCKHFCEEFIDADGGLSFDFNGDEIVDYYCAMGHSLTYGSFCRYYEQ